MYTINQKAIMDQLTEIGGAEGWVLLDDIGEFDEVALNALSIGGFIQVQQDASKRKHIAFGNLELDEPTHLVDSSSLDLGALL